MAKRIPMIFKIDYNSRFIVLARVKKQSGTTSAKTNKSKTIIKQKASKLNQQNKTKTKKKTKKQTNKKKQKEYMNN